jgi:HEPN domain-containing protein
MEFATRLDKFYVPTRYANQWAEKSPHTFFTKREANEAKIMAKEILKFVEKCWKLLEKEEKKRKI